MQFEWDENKAASNFKKHGLDFSDAYRVFEEDTFTFEDSRLDYGEQRFVTLGVLNGVAVVLIHTENIDVIRVISFRKAVKNEQDLYFKNL